MSISKWYVQVIGPYDSIFIGPFDSRGQAVSWQLRQPTRFDYYPMSEEGMKKNIDEFGPCEIESPEIHLGNSDYAFRRHQ